MGGRLARRGRWGDPLCVPPRSSRARAAKVNFVSLILKQQFGACPKAFLTHLATLASPRDFPVHFRPQWAFFDGDAADDAAVLRGCDFVGRLEHAAEDFARLLRAHDFGLPPATPLAHERGTPKLPNHAELRADPEFDALVKRVYARDFRVFGYE